MNVPATNSTTGNGTVAPPTSAAKAQVDYQSFLKLLVTQMKNQDPTKPMDSTEYVAQLATFSGVEQAVQTNAKLDQILQGSALAQADGVIGHTITSADGATSGTVKEVRLTKTGLVAVLSNGKEVTVGAGVTIGAPSAGTSAAEEGAGA